jgi:ribosomal 50S subunit-recycling heat shock protein
LGFNPIPIYFSESRAKFLIPKNGIKVINMRIDKWLSAVNVIKRRTIASDMVKSNVVFINGIKAKASKSVTIGDKITIEYLKGAKEYEVLQIPTTKTIPKSKKEEYVKEL